MNSFELVNEVTTLWLAFGPGKETEKNLWIKELHELVEELNEKSSFYERMIEGLRSLFQLTFTEHSAKIAAEKAKQAKAMIAQQVEPPG